ncbi:oligoendopeptidase F [Risungbinella massiliensis]|uniref:oligoendopeptidase F n=1 Tax=Risungbinella massiliensis TaxID=1329796 RepID=UPI0005CC8D84|nr:oligoendopeptidase F [Risungbinella massiliensis]
MSETKRLPLRSEVDPNFTWRLEEIFATDEDWEQEYQAVKQQLPQLENYRGKLGASSGDLLAALSFRDELSSRLGKLYVYARMRYDQDTTNAHYQAYNDRVSSLHTEASSYFSFYRPEILAIPEEKLKRFLEENQELRLYELMLKELTRFRPHVLSDKEEALLAQASEVLNASSKTYSLLNNADLEFPSVVNEHGEKVEITHGRFITLMESKDRRVRQEAFAKVYDTYGKVLNTMASTLSATVKEHNFSAKVRHYDTARQAALFSNNIPESVYDQLIDTVHEHLPLLHRYLEIRKRALKLDELHLYDLYCPLVADVEMKITYPEAQQILLKGLAPLGKDYLTILQKAFDERWVDVYENKGKRSGAYSFGTYGTNPYILMNWHDNVDNLFTLAHEFGHSLHSYHTRKHQPYPYGDYTIFVAEVASTLNENLLNEYLLQTTKDKTKRLYLINHHLDKFRGTVYRQTMFAEFEKITHQKSLAGEALTAENLTKWYYELNQKYYGTGIVVDEAIGKEWARIPHFYYDFYVYQYATGFSAATALSKQILEEGEPAVKRYLEFLSSGSSADSITLLNRAGVDMTSPDPIRQAFVVFKEYLDELETLLG